MSGAPAQTQLIGSDALTAAACVGVSAVASEVVLPNDAEKYIIDGRRLLKNRRTKRAIQQFRKATRIAPGFAPAWNDLGVAVYKNGQARQAIQYFVTALDIDPTFVDSTMNLVQIFGTLKQPAQAIPYLEALLRHAPDTPEAIAALEKLEPAQLAADKASLLTKEGRAFVEKKAYKPAILRFVEATRVYEGCVPAWNDLGVSLYKLNQADAALEAFSHALALDPSCADAAVNMAAIYANAHSHAKAIPALKKVLDECPDNTEVKDTLVAIQNEIKTTNLIEHHIFEGRKCMRDGDLKSAITEYKKALEIDGACYIAHNDLGVALWSHGDASGSIDALKAALSYKPGFVDAAINLASIFAALERHDEAIPFLNEAAGIHPDSVELKKQLEKFAPSNIVQHKVTTLVQRGRELVDANHIEQAIQCFIAATDLDPTCSAAWSDLGVALAANDQIKTSIGAFERALRADPHHIDAALNLATVYDNVDRFESSITILEKALIDNPANPELVEALAYSREEFARSR